MNATKNKIVPETTQGQIMENQRLVLWCFMVASILGFGAFTSAYIVRIAQGNWLSFPIPDVFMYNIGVVLASSASMFMAYRSAKNDELEQVKYYTWGAIITGVLFLVIQLIGYQQLTNQSIFFSPARTDNGDLSPLVSGSFFYVITFAHLMHVVAGLIFLFILQVKAYRWQVHKKNMLTISLASTFWHFVGILWIYLYLFLKLYN